MTTKYLPDADHVVRHLNSQLLIREGDQVIGCFPQAFELKTGEKYLSAAWLEFFPGTVEERKSTVVAAYAAARTVRPSHGFAFGNVGQVKNACASYGLKIRVIHEPSKTNPNPAYTAIRNYKSDDIELLQLLASDAWSEVVEAKDISSFPRIRFHNAETSPAPLPYPPP
jgi:hypothetical protein